MPDSVVKDPDARKRLSLARVATMRDANQGATLSNRLELESSDREV